MMLAAASGLSTAQILLKGREQIPPAVVEKLMSYVARRAEREPIQHILQEAFFMGLRFDVGPAVLVPRPETECLVEEAVKIIGANFGGQARILDIGAGSGAISVSLLKLSPKSVVTAVEVSPAAAAVCLANAEAHQVADRLTLITADFLAEAGHPGGFNGGQKYDIFVSNPPYIQKDLIDSLDAEVKNYEPHLALVGLDDDGLGFYRAFARSLPALAEEPGAYILCEFGLGQGEEIALIFARSNWQGVSLLPDLSGRPRMLMARSPK
jgi:release factor glutamine methyltransferase